MDNVSGGHGPAKVAGLNHKKENLVVFVPCEVLLSFSPATGTTNKSIRLTQKMDVQDILKST